jgi:pyruvate,water dikinase
MKNVVWFKDIKKEDVSIAGGKGANLGEMYAAKLPIPPGFVVSSYAFKQFLSKTRIGPKIYSILKNLTAEDTELIHDASEKIQDIILNARMPEKIEFDIKEAYDNMNIDIDYIKSINKNTMSLIKAGRDLPYVAVRSSATAEDLPEASFAGQQATYLNIKGKDNLIKAVQLCWASLFTARAIYYRIKNNFPHEKVLIAVVVQKMINSFSSGVIFSINPATNEEEIVIEAGFGLGEAIVGGEITPDHYIVDKKTLKIKSKKINKQEFMYIRDEHLGRTIKKKLKEEQGTQQKLKDREIEKLAELTKKIEEHYKKPQDLEFAIESNRIYIVQSRPITTMKAVKKKKEEEKEIKQESILTGLGASPGSASGKVKLVHGIQDLDKVHKGDVLVATMTMPDYVPSMEKASAIVTDEGGLTCFEGSTKLLTNKGFIEIREAVRRIKEKEKLWILSYDYKKFKPKWKKIVNAGSRISKIIRVVTSQKGTMGGNYLDLTADHKMFTFRDRKLIKKEISKVLENKEMLCLIDSLPKIENQFNNYKLAYLNGVILSDGYVKIINHPSGNPRRGYVVFTQKEIERKKEFIQTFKDYFYDVFGKELKQRIKESSSYIRGRLIQGTATDFTCYSLQIASLFSKMNQNLAEWCLQLNELGSLNFLGGLIDGDGSFCNNRINIYVSKENVLQGIIISCLNLGIVPQVTVNRSIYNVQILERMNDILQFCKKIKIQSYQKTMGTKLFSAKQVLGDIIDKINWKGKIRPYVDNNLLINSKKILERIIPICGYKQKLELLKILNSSIRMQRVNKIQEFGETEVFNVEVEADNEMDRNYIVFTKRYTPLLVSNSHASIVSRELGIPCIVGTGNATKLLKEEQLITVDGSNGKVYSGSLEIEEEKEEEVKEFYETKTKIYMNLSEPGKIDEYKNLFFDGIGLMRIEFIITDEIKKHPLALIKEGKQDVYINKLAQGISKVASAIKPKPIIVRFSDFKTNEYKNLESGQEFEPHEGNPMMGWRGISRYISKEYQPAFRLECKAIKKIRDSGLTNIHVMLPFVRNTEEVKEVLNIMKEEGLEKSDNFEIWLMAEVPSMALITEEFAQLPINGASIGSNDLTQLCLGVDRDSGILGKMGYFNERNNAVKQAIKNIIEGFHKYNKSVSICGQAPSVYPEITKFLVENKIDDISINPDVVNKTRKLVHNVEKTLSS